MMATSIFTSTVTPTTFRFKVIKEPGNSYVTVQVIADQRFAGELLLTNREWRRLCSALNSQDEVHVQIEKPE